MGGAGLQTLFPMNAFRRLLLAALLLLPAADLCAHSGKARFHLVIDTDGAADDLRTISLLLGNREVEVLAVTTSEGALPPAETAVRVAALLREFRHEGIPVGAGRSSGAQAPAWRALSRRTNWGDTTRIAPPPPARELLAATLAAEEEPVVVVALGALTNLAELLQARPDLCGRIERILWYDDSTAGQPGANYAADSLAARRLLASGIPMQIVSEHPAAPMVIDTALLERIAAVGTPYARKIVAAHRTPPLDRLVAAGHLRGWDDLVALRLFAPELFDCRPAEASSVPGASAGAVEALVAIPASAGVSDVPAGTAGHSGRGIERCTLAARAAAEQAPETLLALLRGKPDAESRVFYGFPTAAGLYAQDVAPIIDSAIARHGPSEWRAGVLTNELHGHLGIYATIGVKMGIRAREFFNIGVDDIRVTSFAGSRPPVSCMNDGLQVSTGATLGHGLITVAAPHPPRPEALFRFKEKALRLKLKPAYADRIRRDVEQGVARYGNGTEAYWQYIRGLALRYWLAFDRHELFEESVE